MNPRYSRLRPHRPHTKTGWGGLIVIAIIAIAILGTCAAYANTKTEEVVVTGKERVCDRSSDGNQDCKYLVFTTTSTYRITDYIGRLTSSDAYGRIIPCHRYRIDTYGFRFGLTSSYPNIKKAVDLGPVEGCQPSR